MANAAAFDYTAWIIRYPEFSPSGSQPVSQPLGAAYFVEAGLYLDNVGQSPVTSDSQQSLLMNMLTAHIAALNTPTSTGAPASSLVGRISNASEGSVSVAAENDYPPGTPQWFQQTKYGTAFWAATIQYRTARYLHGPVLGVPANQGRGLFGIGLPFIRRC